MVKFLEHIRKDKASSAIRLDSRPAQLLPSELCCCIEPVSDSLTFSLPHALLMFMANPDAQYLICSTESHDAVSLFSLSLSISVSVCLPPLRPRCLCPGNRLFMSIPTGNPLINVTVCSEIKHL
ncbi:hypothetical protein L3Q82_025768, partial [Scortum barcoo]